MREERSSAADLITRSPSSRVKPAFWIMTSVESKRSGPTSASKIDLYLASTIDSSTDEGGSRREIRTRPGITEISLLESLTLNSKSTD